MKRELLFLLLVMTLVLGLIAGCDDDDDDDPGTDADTDTDSDTDTEPTFSVEVSFDGLESLGEDFVYEGWLIVDGAPETSGRFTVDADGMPDPAEFEITETQANDATAFVLTIEPAVGDPPEPSDTHVLGGDFSSGMASLTIGHEAALGDDFTSAAGTYILETPTTTATDDYDQGIWWLDPSGPAPVASLTLPTLPDGWLYEGWIVTGTGPVSTGTFATASEEDSDGAGPTSGTEASPPFPGQDYIDPAMVLTDLTAVISVEPDPDDAATPFAIKPLVDEQIEDLGAGVSQSMANNIAGSAPTGTATIQ